ncbi:MAG: O-antigen ligase family protein [Vicinamibacteria bacterium]|nr:O-antigen ligase family protein [Vicinamibacteria bacterium]
MTLARAQFALLAGVAATALVSIFAAQVALGLAAAIGLTRWAIGQAQPEALPAGAPLLAFSVWTLLAAAFSGDPVASHEDAKKLVLFVLLYLFTDSLAQAERRGRVLDAAFLGGSLLAAGALMEWAALGFDTLDNRPRSFVGHYMTASGLFMGIACLGAGRLLFSKDPWAAPPRLHARLLLSLLGGLAVLGLLRRSGLFALEGERLFVAALAAAAIAIALDGAPLAPGAWRGLTACAVSLSLAALLVSRTRSAWLGALFGLALLAIVRAPKLLWGLGVGLVVLAVLRPAPVVERLTLQDASSIDRLYMWRAGLDMIVDKPLFGHGPGRVVEIYPRYRWPEAPNPNAPHLHDNLLQIAAERGLPCVVWSLWLLAVLVRDSWLELRRASALAGACSLSVIAAVAVSGLFEYNFGDSEVLMLTLLATSLPYAARRERRLATG